MKSIRVIATGENNSHLARVQNKKFASYALTITPASERIMSKQLFRSGTSIGANIREAQHAQSYADFLSKKISLKECNETEYWLQLLHDNGYLNDLQYTSINTDRVRIHKLLNAIVSTTRRKIGK